MEIRPRNHSRRASLWIRQAHRPAFFTGPLRPGFTLIELAAVVSILILLLLISAPLLTGYQKTTKLRNEARVLATNLRLAAQRAVTEQVIYQIAITSSSTYQMVNGQTGAVVKTVTLDPEIRVAGLTGLSDDVVLFTSTGAAIEAGTIVLTNSKLATTTLSIKPSGYVQIIE